MPIYHVTYLSDGLQVKGYLGVPEPFQIHPDDLSSLLMCAAQTDLRLPVRQVVPDSDLSAGGTRPRSTWPAAPLPGFIYCRGGIGKVGMVKLDWVERFMRHGYVVFAPSYRGNEGGEGRDEFGGADREDVHAAFRLLQRLPFVHSDRIYVMGFSRGAINAFLTGIEVPGVRAVVSWGGVSDLSATYVERVDLRRMLRRVIGGPPWKVPTAYQARSSVYLADAIRCPVLIIHGSEDVQVPVAHGIRLYDRLSELGRPVVFHQYQGYGHHFPALVHERAIAQMFATLEKIS